MINDYIPDWVQRTHYKTVLCRLCGGDGLKHELISKDDEDDRCENCGGRGYVEDIV